MLISSDQIFVQGREAFLGDFIRNILTIGGFHMDIYQLIFSYLLWWKTLLKCTAWQQF